MELVDTKVSTEDLRVANLGAGWNVGDAGQYSSINNAGYCLLNKEITTMQNTISKVRELAIEIGLRQVFQM